MCFLTCLKLGIGSARGSALFDAYSESIGFKTICRSTTLVSSRQDGFVQFRFRRPQEKHDLHHLSLFHVQIGRMGARNLFITGCFICAIWNITFGYEIFRGFFGSLKKRLMRDLTEGLLFYNSMCNRGGY